MRRKYRKTGNLFYKVLRNILTSNIQKRIIKTKNKTLQQKRANIKNTDSTQTYRVIGSSKTKIPVLQNITHNTIHYTDEEKSEGFAGNFEQVQLNAHNTYSSLKQQIEHKATFIRKIYPTHENFLSCRPRIIKDIIKKLPNNKAPGPNQIISSKFKKKKTL